MGRPGLKAFGEFPQHLYRCLDKEEYAVDFAERGLIRFTFIRAYAKIEDAARRDETEGTGEVSFPHPRIQTVHLDKETLRHLGSTFGPGAMHLSTSTASPLYILSFCCPPDGAVDHLPCNWGQWAVKVNDPARLAQDITDRLGFMDYTDSPVECAQVRYQWGEHLPAQPDQNEELLIRWAYKRPFFDISSSGVSGSWRPCELALSRLRTDTVSSILGNAWITRRSFACQVLPHLAHDLAGLGEVDGGVDLTHCSGPMTQHNPGCFDAVLSPQERGRVVAQLVGMPAVLRLPLL